MSEYLSANSEEFLKPLENHLESGKPLALRVCWSRVGGGSNECLLKTVDDLVVLRSNHRWWKPQAIIYVCFHPFIIWDGNLTMELFQKMWKVGIKSSEDVLLIEPNGFWSRYETEDLYAWVCEFMGKKVVVMKETKYEDLEALVPMPDGTLVSGAY
ncbi:hypothetical protein C4577_02040 [Candidatus Parcubacteria bacterium]|nr:MAG: hypothetical protein C4577_02040 [Candidatus Parcubacteria bacterium]